MAQGPFHNIESNQLLGLTLITRQLPVCAQSNPILPRYTGSIEDKLGYGGGTAAHLEDLVLQQRASQRARSKLVAKVRWLGSG